MRGCLLALLFLTVAPRALAQTATTGGITIRETNDTDGIVNIAECSGAAQDGLVFTWTISGFTVPGTYQLQVSDKTGCPTTTDSGARTVTIADSVAANSASGSFPANGSFAVQDVRTPLGFSCEGGSRTVYFCVNYLATGITAGTAAATGSLKFDLAKPAPPEVNEPTPGDGALNVSWSPGSRTSNGSTTIATSVSYDVTATATADPTDVHTQKVITGTSTRVTGLKNGVEYQVVVIAFSEGENASDPSTPVKGVPAQVQDFWRLYREQTTAREQGGCATGGTGLAALLGLVPLAWRRRRAP